MKINTKTVWQMTADGMEIIEQDSFDYSGRLAQCFGGGSETESTTTTTQDIDTTTIGIEDVEGTAFAAGGDVEFTQNITDAGAIQGAIDIGQRSFDFAGEFGAEAFDFAGSAFDFAGDSQKQATKLAQQAIGSQAKAIQKVGEASRSDATMLVTNLAKFGAIAVVIIFGFRAFAQRGA